MGIFTRRETHVVVVLVLTVLIIIVSGVDQGTLEDYVLLWLMFCVMPIGLYVATDPERRN